MSDDHTKFIREFKRCLSGHDVKWAAEMMNVSPSTVYYWMSGKTTMNADAMLRAMWLFGIDARLLYHEKWRTLS